MLGKYELIAEIARGGMGIVYLAHAGGVGGFKKLVVLKELKAELANEESFRDMFLDEARLAARLNHRNVVQTNEVGNADGRYFIAMDYLEGRSLNRVIKAFEGTDKPVSLQTQVRIFAEALSGLHYAHELTDFDGSALKVVHRDVCPQNVFVTFDGQVKIVDFGVAKARNRLQETQAGTLKGRVAYMSPEHIGSGDIDARADVFAVGVMLFEALTGKRFWGGAAEIDILKALLERTIPKLPDDDTLPKELREMVTRATHPEKTERFATAHEFRQNMEQYLLRSPNAESLNELGARLMTAFSPERYRLRKVIEEHVQRVEKGVGGDGDIPRLEMKGVLGTPLPGDVSGPRVSSPPSSRSLPPSPDSSARVSAIPSSVTPASGTPSLGTPLTQEMSVGVIAAKPSRVPYYIGAGAMLVALVAAGYSFGNHAAAPPTTAAAQAVPIAAPATVKDDAVDVTISATPPAATIYVDDAQVPGNPFRARYPKGGTHRVTASAPGYLPKTQQLAFEANLMSTIALEKAPAGAPTTAPVWVVPRAQTGATQPAAKDAAVVSGVASAAVDPTPPASAAAPTPAPTSTTPAATSTAEVNPNGGVAPTRKIDSTNPYAH
jgi:serine/threonine-protein kinase